MFQGVKWIDRIIYKMLMLTYKSYYNIAPSYLCELINKKESHLNTRLGTDHHQLIIPPISKDCSNTFLERSFIYAAPCEWNTLSKQIITSNFDWFRKSVKQCYLHNIRLWEYFNHTFWTIIKESTLDLIGA